VFYLFITTIKLDSSKRLWIVILIAVTIAISLIITSFICVYLKPDKSLSSANDIFNIKGYYTEYELMIFSNKNQNSYYIKEWYLKDNENESFKVEFENETKDKITYVLTDNALKISSNKQLSSFSLDNFNICKKNLLSISTFLQMYKNILENNDNKITKIENANIDNKKHYMIYLNDSKSETGNLLVDEYNDFFRAGLNISKIELIVNDKNKPIEYYVFDDKENVITGIKYTKFDIIDNFDEKTFANLNK
jgi:hypothetical protein